MRLRSDSSAIGRLLDFLAVFVGTCEKEGAMAHQLMPAGYRIGENSRVGMADMWSVIYVVDGCCEVTVTHSIKLAKRRVKKVIPHPIKIIPAVTQNAMVMVTPLEVLVTMVPTIGSDATSFNTGLIIK